MANRPKVSAVILAAGVGTRFGADKSVAQLGGKPVWRWSYDTFSHHPEIDEVLLVIGPHHTAAAENFNGIKTVVGGATRQASSRIGVFATDATSDFVLVHDAARPFVTHSLITEVIAACRRSGASAATIPVVDTLRSLAPEGHHPDRGQLQAMQTPQAALRSRFIEAFDLEAATSEERAFTDEIGLIETAGYRWEPVPGSIHNFKVTTPEDFQRAETMLISETRTGLGYDVHAFSDDPGRELWLGGVHFPGARALEGHSDADVLLHAVVDALLGAAALGDIGVHFPPSEPRWKGEPSTTFLKHAAAVIADDSWEVVNVDATVIAEHPKIMARAAEIRAAIAGALGIDIGRVSVKATTNEGLGSIGRGEGIAAFATATLKRLT